MNLNLQQSPCESWAIALKEEVAAHPAWHGMITGMAAEALLRDQKLHTFVIRQGEKEMHYYLSFVQGEDNNFKHQPFVIEEAHRKWFYRNTIPHLAASVDELIPLIMHIAPELCIPLSAKNETVRFI